MDTGWSYPAEPSRQRPFSPTGVPPDVEPRRHRRREVSPLRPYLLTGGRARPLDATLEIEAQVVTTDTGYHAIEGLAYEQRDIVELCRQPIAVAEVAAQLGLHLGVARVLVGDLLALRHLAVRRPEPGTNGSTEVLERVIRGLQAID